MMKHLFIGAILFFGSFYSPMTYASTDAMDEAVVGGGGAGFCLKNTDA